MSNDLIIEKPDLQSHMQRFGWSAVTFIFWAVYIYLWLPLITLLAWWVGVKLFKTHFIDLRGYTGLQEQMMLYLSIIALISLMLISWALIERFRFKNASRRGERPKVSTQEIAHFYGQDEAAIHHYRAKKSIVVQIADDGRITGFSDYQAS